MSSPISPLGDRLVQTIAGRIARQSESKKKIRQETKDALEKFVKNRGKAHEKLTAKLSKINLKEFPASGFKILWTSRQNRINHDLWRTKQRLLEAVQLLSKEQENQGREMIKLMRLLLEQTDYSLPEDDGV